MKRLKNVIIYFSISLSCSAYSQSPVQKIATGHLDFDSSVDTVRYVAEADFLKGQLLTTGKKLSFKIPVDEDLRSGIDIPGIGELAIVTSGTGMGGVEDVKIYSYDENLSTWIYAKSLTITPRVDRGMLSPSIEFSSVQGESESIDGKKVVYKYTKPSSDNLFKLVKDARENKYSRYDIIEYFYNYPVTLSNVRYYNDLAYYMQGEILSIFVLEEVIAKFPKRVVAHLNLGDSYFELGNEEKARQHYKTYVALLKGNKKGAARIPKYVFDRLK